MGKATTTKDMVRASGAKDTARFVGMPLPSFIAKGGKAKSSSWKMVSHEMPTKQIRKFSV